MAKSIPNSRANHPSPRFLFHTTIIGIPEKHLKFPPFPLELPNHGFSPKGGRYSGAASPKPSLSIPTAPEAQFSPTNETSIAYIFYNHSFLNEEKNDPPLSAPDPRAARFSHPRSRNRARIPRRNHRTRRAAKNPGSLHHHRRTRRTGPRRAHHAHRNSRTAVHGRGTGKSF